MVFIERVIMRCSHFGYRSLSPGGYNLHYRHSSSWRQCSDSLPPHWRGKYLQEPLCTVGRSKVKKSYTSKDIRLFKNSLCGHKDQDSMEWCYWYDSVEAYARYRICWVLVLRWVALKFRTPVLAVLNFNTSQQFKCVRLNSVPQWMLRYKANRVIVCMYCRY